MGRLAQGTVYLVIVQAIFLASGYLIHAFLGRTLGPADYGTFGIVVSLITMINLFFTSGLPHAASRFIAAGERRFDEVRTATESIACAISLTLFVLYFMAAGSIASLLGDPSLVPYLRLSALIIPFHAIYALDLGLLNGRMAFRDQAVAMVSFSVTRLVGVFVLVLLGYSIMGAIGGFIIASVIGLLAARRTLPGSGPRDVALVRELVTFSVPIMLYSVAFTSVMSLDLFVVKRLLAENVKVGFYVAAVNLSRIPFHLMNGLVLALLPVRARCAASDDESDGRAVSATALRYLLILILPTAAIMCATSEELVALVYSRDFLPAAVPLFTLVLGACFFTAFSVLSTLIIADGKATVPMLFSFALAPVSLVLNLSLVPSRGLEGAALSTLLTGTCGMLLAGAYLWKRSTRPPFEPISALRTSLAALLAYLLLSRGWLGFVPLPAAVAAAVVLYLVVLRLSGETADFDPRSLLASLGEEGADVDAEDGDAK